jgi:hypothetical protein
MINRFQLPETNLDACKHALNSVGWFIPPYVNVNFLNILAQEIRISGTTFDQRTLARVLASIYSSLHLAAMVNQRYPITPCVSEYKEIISEAVEAHFIGLDHAAVSALLPVIEGAGRKLASNRSIHVSGIKTLFTTLATDCKDESKSKNIGAVGEIASMMDSFVEFANHHLYVHSDTYALSDKTNRHGILHGAYTDSDYGEPINFFKSIAAVDFLCFVASFRARLPCLAPDPTPACEALAAHYAECGKLGADRPKIGATTLS